MNKENNCLFTRQRADIHPQCIADYVPKHPFKPKYDVDLDAYDSLTDDSSFSDYAWAFLRRNRFFQNSIDKQIQQFINIEIWGHKPSEDSPAINGLSAPKNYWETCSTESSPVKWEGIHTFFQTFSEVRRPLVSPKDGVHFALVQTPFVFDTDYLLGPGTSAIDVQLRIARAIMVNQAKQAGLKIETSTIPSKEKLILKKKNLRTLLRVTDLLSPEYKNAPSEDKRVQRKAIWEIGENKPKLTDLVPKLPESDLGRQKNKNKDVSLLVDRAYEMIYEWQFLQLLQYDNWEDHFYPPEKQNPKNGKVQLAAS